LLGVKLKHLPAWTESRRAAAGRYRELLTSCDGQIAPPYEPAWSRAVYHLFVVRVPNRAELMRHMSAAGIGTGIHYPPRKYSPCLCTRAWNATSKIELSSS
jgi:dTDP-4-amino-4,6-dideoxygalactose transaminase